MLSKFNPAKKMFVTKKFGIFKKSSILLKKVESCYENVRFRQKKFNPVEKNIILLKKFNPVKKRFNPVT